MRKLKGLVLSGVLAAAVALGALVAAPESAQAFGVGVAVYVPQLQLYRLYNPNTGEHFYTPGAGERDSLVKVGWTYEGVGWSALDIDEEVGFECAPVYRLYNPYAPGGDHHYTTSEYEYEQLQKVGWRGEGAAWKVPVDGTDWTSGAATILTGLGEVPVYRLYNPNAASGAHHYTTDAGEAKALTAAGWKDEGVGWNATGGRKFLLDESAPAYVREAAAVLEVPSDEYVTYFTADVESNEYLDVPEGTKALLFHSDDAKMYAATYLSSDNSIYTVGDSFMPWQPAM